MEGELKITPADRKKRVLVVGGGPGGMKAACTAAEKGHQVILVERNDRLGGQLLLNRHIPGRQEMVSAATDLENNLKALHVEILLGKKADYSFIKDCAPEALVLATGARPVLPDIKGIEGQKVALAWDVLNGKTGLGKRVVVVGGNAVGLETALYLADQGTISPDVLHFLAANRAETWDNLEKLINRGNKSVTVLEMTRKMGRDIGSSTRWTVISELRRLGVKMITDARAVEVNSEGVRIERENKDDSLIPADSVVIAAGARPENDLLNEIGNLVPEIHTIGDAKEPRKAMEAIKEGFLTGLRI